MNVLIWHFICGIIACIYQAYDIKRSNRLEEADYFYLFGVVCFGYVSFVVMLADIHQRWWWNK